MFRHGPNGLQLSSASLSRGPPRSHATNASDTNAGNADNPLEIDLDSDDDDVEIVAVRSPGATRAQPYRSARSTRRGAAPSDSNFPDTPPLRRRPRRAPRSAEP